MSDPEFQVTFRTIRIGSLRTFPPKDAKNCKLRLTKKEMKFKVVIDQRQKPEEQNEALKITIPCVGITKFEGYLQRGCPVIWVTTDSASARKIRQATRMRLTTTPTPFFDPKDKELADQRIAIIPSDDPVNQIEVAKFRTIMRAIASERQISLDSFFVEMTRADCNDQLVRCTKYISYLTKLQSTKPVKQEYFPEMKSNDAVYSSPIIISSDEDLIKKEPQTPKEDKEKSEPLEMATPQFESKATSSSDDLPALNTPTKRGNAEPESPDLFDFSDEDQSTNSRKEDENKKKNIWATGENEMETDETVDTKRKVSSESLPLAGKRPKIDDVFEPNSRPVAERSDSMHSSSTKDVTSDAESIAGSEKSKSNSTKQFYGSGSKYKLPEENKQKTKVGNTAGVKNGVREEPTSNISNLPFSKIDLKSIRGTASLSCDMQTLYQDMESMLGATPLCICVVKSPYVINLSVTNDIKCMAIDNVDGRLTGCINSITDPVMMRPSMNIPVHGMCEGHRSRMLRHECCPGCGMFCAGGTFLVCNSTAQHQHRFHRNCLMLTRHSIDCPHCGSPMSQVHEVTVDPSNVQYEVKIENGSMEENLNFGFPDCVVKIPGVTKVPPASFIDEEKLILGPERGSLENMMLNLELDLPKKLRFQAKNLIQLVKQGDGVKVMQLLCGVGGDPSARASSNSRTALHEAVARGNLPIIHLLVLAGADVNAEDDDGKTPVFYAEEMKRMDLLNYLIVCNSNLSHKDCEGMTPLHHAAKHGRMESCQVLLQYGKENLNSVDEGGWTPLVWAAEHRQTDTAECLMYYGADVHAMDKEGNICLQWAALAGNKDILLMCLKRNCYIDHQNMHGDTALHIAARENNYDCIITLLGWGADPGMKNKEGRRPAECAPEYSMCWVSLKINSFIRNSISDHKGFVPFDRERILSVDVSRGRERLPISCVNAVDEAPCPANPPHEFLYVSKNIFKQTSVNSVLSIMKSCDCSNDCLSCICGELSVKCWYDGGGRLVPAFNFNKPPHIYECNLICQCPSSCRNRVIQKGGVRYRLQMFRTKNMGWGVRTLETIPRGSFVLEFVGEVITDADSKENDSYLFDLDEKPGGMYTIDGRFYGNISRFINHHCDPNLAPVRFFVDHHDTDFPRIAFFATREIHVGEQLCFDYGDTFWEVKSQHFTCECGAGNCRYSLQAFRKRMEEKEDQEMEE